MTNEFDDYYLMEPDGHLTALHSAMRELVTLFKKAQECSPDKIPQGDVFEDPVTGRAFLILTLGGNITIVRLYTHSDERN